MRAARQTLTKPEILRGYRVFSETISSGTIIRKGSVRCFYRDRTDRSNIARIGFAVTRNIRGAASRNRIRRWMKEAYRVRKNVLIEPAAERVGQLDAVFLFSARNAPTLNHRVRDSIDQAISSLLKELRRRFSDTP